MRSDLGLFVPLLLIAACNQRRQQSTESHAVSAAARTAAAPSSSSTLAELEGSVELLHRTASVVVTSSHADGNSTGAYLVDELPETSWQPNPPDPAPWIEIELPAAAAIERVEITLATASSSLSEASLKVANLLVPTADQRWQPQSAQRSLNERGELTLKPDAAADLTRLRLSLNGAPRGLRIAELRVIGRIARRELLAAAIPETRVQGIPRIDYAGSRFAAWITAAPYADESALCQAFVRSLPTAPGIEQPVGDLCHKLPDVAPTGVAPTSIRAIERYELTVADDLSPTQTTALVARAESGLYPANLALADSRNEALCPGGPEADMRTSNFRFEHGVLLIDRTRYFTPGLSMMTTPGVAPAVAAASVVRCRFEERLSCREFITQFGAPLTLVDDNGPPYRVTLPKIWDWTRSLAISDHGSVRLSPCRTPASKNHEPRVVPCATPGAEIL